MDKRSTRTGLPPGLPPGYALEEYGRGAWTGGPMLLVLIRPDGWPAATFAAGAPADTIEQAAWRDHRRRTLRVIAGGAIERERK